MTRTTRRVFVFVVLVAAILVLPGLGPGGGGDWSTRSVGLDAATAGDTWESQTVLTDALAVGLSWDSAPPERAWVRTLADGVWSPWLELELGDEHGPDPGTDEPLGRATDPLYVGDDVSAVRYRVAGPGTGVAAELVERAPRGLRSDILGRLESERFELVPPAGAAPDRPTIVSRSAWGGDTCQSEVTDEEHLLPRVQLAFVHHTAGAVGNPYDRVLAICKYHTDVKGWDDIAYNFLIAPDGTIFEGRAGGVERAIRGAHTSGFNSYSTGVAILGDYSASPPSAAALDALARLLAWKLDLHHVDPLGEVTLPSLGNTKYAEGVPVTLARVSGHRDAQSTACPGDACHVLLPTIRSDTDALGGERILLETPNRLEGNRENGYTPITIGARFTSPMSWSLRLVDQSGRTVMARSGTGTSVSVPWDGAYQGSRLPHQDLRLEIDARTASGVVPTPVRVPLELGTHLGRFLDDDDSVHEADIERLAELGVTRGCNPPDNDLFCPEEPVTRGQAAAFFARLLGLPSAAGDTFDDDDDSIFEADIEKVAAVGILRGCNPPANTRVCPDDLLTREQMAAVIARGLSLPRGPDAFIDDDGSIFEADINALAASGITRGCNPPANSRFCGPDLVLRQQLASFLVRAHDWLGS